MSDAAQFCYQCFKPGNWARGQCYECRNKAIAAADASATKPAKCPECGTWTYHNNGACPHCKPAPKCEPPEIKRKQCNKPEKREVSADIRAESVKPAKCPTCNDKDPDCPWEPGDEMFAPYGAACGPGGAMMVDPPAPKYEPDKYCTHGSHISQYCPEPTCPWSATGREPKPAKCPHPAGYRDPVGNAICAVCREYIDDGRTYDEADFLAQEVRLKNERDRYREALERIAEEGMGDYPSVQKIAREALKKN